MSAVEHDVDEIAVERACNGDQTVSLNRAEMAEAWSRLEARGLSGRHIADVLGTVVRWRTGVAHPITRPGVTVDSTKDKIATALRSPHKQVRTAAAKANQALATLDTVLAEWDAKEQALERVAELERELAMAKAELKKPAKVATPSVPGEHKQARAWAREQGIQVPDIGRVPNEVLEQYRRETGAAA